jgi:hypothetical protein
VPQPDLPESQAASNLDGCNCKNGQLIASTTSCDTLSAAPRSSGACPGDVGVGDGSELGA